MRLTPATAINATRVFSKWAEFLTSRASSRALKGRVVVSHGRYATFQLAEVTVPRQIFADILLLIARLRARPAPA